MSDDEIIGLKSTSIKFKKYKIVCINIIYNYNFYDIFVVQEKIDFNIFSLILSLFVLSLIYQILKFDKNNPSTCLKMFKLNNFTGFTLFLCILSINYF